MRRPASKSHFSSSPLLTVCRAALRPTQTMSYVLPKELDEKVAKLHLLALGAELIVVTQEQADRIGVKVEGPFKGGHYHYC